MALAAAASARLHTAKAVARARAGNGMEPTISPSSHAHQYAKMSLSPCCLKIGSFDKGTPAGKIEKIGGLDTYVTGNTSSKSAILLVADVFGISLSK